MKCFLTILLSLSVSLCWGQVDCSDYRTGKFKISLNRYGQNENYVIERLDNIQIEKDLINGTEARLKLRWISDCEYYLSYISGPEEMKAVFEEYNNILQVKITNTTDNGYEYTAKLQGSNYQSSYFARRIED